MSNIKALVPAFVEEAIIGRNSLDNVARSGEKIRLEVSTMKVTCDIIVRAVLGVSVGIQTGEDTKIYPSMKKTIAQLVPDWTPSSLSRLLNPLRSFQLKASNSILNSELSSRVYHQFRTYEKIEGPETINSLAIKTYLKNIGGVHDPKSDIDPEFLRNIVENLKMFLFAGHDTTATTLCYCYYYLHQTPEALARIRAEHDSVFPSRVLKMVTEEISSQPQILNKLPYTTTVIKECLRLEPPVPTVRAGGPDFFLTHPVTKKLLPSDGFILWASSKAIHRHPTYWADPDDLLPGRWLQGETRKSTWRPFELGARACIGQELAMTELKLLLVMTVRDLDVVPDYDVKDEWMFGSQAFQVSTNEELTSHLKSGMPVKIKWRECA